MRSKEEMKEKIEDLLSFHSCAVSDLETVQRLLYKNKLRNAEKLLNQLE